MTSPARNMPNFFPSVPSCCMQSNTTCTLWTRTCSAAVRSAACFSAALREAASSWLRSAMWPSRSVLISSMSASCPLRSRTSPSRYSTCSINNQTSFVTVHGMMWLSNLMEAHAALEKTAWLSLLRSCHGQQALRAEAPDLC
jgi:hypothetical protein